MRTRKKKAMSIHLWAAKKTKLRLRTLTVNLGAIFTENYRNKVINVIRM